MEYGLVLVWLGTVLALGAAGLPIAARLFPRFPGRGAALALPCSLVVVTVTAYWAGRLRFGLVAPLAGVAVLVAAAGLATRGGADVRPRGAVVPAGVFTAAFLLLVAVRAVNPGIVPVGGEKFLDYALLNAVLRADVLPPQDPWFAGRPVRYYYGAQLRAAVLVRLTGVPPRVGYNLALATGFGTLVTTAYGLAGALADARGREARSGGLLGAFFVGVAGNLATPVRKLFGLLPHDLALRYGHGVFAGVRAPHAEAVREVSSLASFSHWPARYVIEGTLTPFPFWAFFNGDLNAYMLATPFLLLVAALGFAYYRTPGAAVRRRRAIVFGASPLVGGVLAFTSTWSVPTTVGLTWLALVFADPDPATLLPERVAARVPGRDVRSGGLDPPAELRRTLVAGGVAAVCALELALVAAPFLLFHTPVNRGVGVLPPRSALVPLVLAWGVFLAAFALFGWPRARRLVDRRTVAAGAVGYALLGAVLLQFDLAAVVLVGPFLLGGWLLLRRRDADVGYETVLVVAGAGLVLAPEFVYARVYPFTPTNPRWNTVYKVSMQVWIVWGTAAAAALADVLGRLREGVDRPTAAPDVGRGDVRPALTALVVLAILLASATFGTLALGGRFQQTLDSDPEPVTLDGTAYVERRHPDAAAAIAWLDGRAGTPTIVTKPGIDTYSWVNAPSSLTGVPTVVGWTHEVGYRGPTAYERRRADVETLYTTDDSDTVRRLLDEYDVRYVYVGPNERAAYGGDQRFAAVRGLDVAYRNGNVTVYRVADAVVDSRADARRSSPNTRAGSLA